MKDDKLKIGIVGAGYLGTFHLEKYLTLDDVRVMGVSDVDPKVRDKISEKYQVPCFSDHHDLLESVDAVSIVVPTNQHYQISSDFLDAGKDVFVEKPFTTTLDEAQNLIEKAEAKGLILQVGHLERFNPAIIALNDVLHMPMFIESHRLSPFSNRGADVDVVLDLMIHDIDIILNIVKSNIVRIEAVGVPVITANVDIVNARLNFESGCIANITASRVSASKMRKIRIFQSDAYISIDYAAQNITVYRKVKDENKQVSIVREDINISTSDNLAEEIRSFVGSVKTRTQPLVTGRDGKRALEVAMDIRESLKTSLNRLRELDMIEEIPAL